VRVLHKERGADVAITSTDPTAAYLLALAAGHADAILSLFSGEPVIDDPRSGRVAGHEVVAAFVASQAQWVQEHDVEFEHLRTTVGRGLSLTESLARLTVDGERTELPFAVVGDETGGALREIRVYHSNWPLEGRHRLRPPILPEDRNLVIPDIVGAYMEALAAGNLAGSEAVFEPTGYFREPSGGIHIYRGTEGIREAYGAFFKVGGIRLRHCTIIDDGVVCGVEFIADGWGPRPFEPQAGIGIYERGPSGKLVAARIYDDVNVDLGLRS
jgi:hypothetical protein